MLTEKKSFEVICEVDQNDLEMERRTMIDHPIMLLAAKVGESAAANL